MFSETVKTKTAEEFSHYLTRDTEKAKEFYDAKAKDFYGHILGLDETGGEGVLKIQLCGQNAFVYPENDHHPAALMVLNFMVADIEKAVDELTRRGVHFEAYDGEMKTDAKGIFHGADCGCGPNIAWFKDPAGNTLSIVEKLLNVAEERR